MPKFQKFGIKILLAMFAFVTVAGSLSYVQPSNAVSGPIESSWGSDPSEAIIVPPAGPGLAVTVTGDTPAAIAAVKTTWKTKFKNVLINIVIQSA